jgi:hypothetical protein
MATVVGSLGTGLLLLAYGLHARRVIPLARTYAAMNAVGALLAGVASTLLHFVPFVVLEAAWFCVAVAGFFRPPHASQS